MKTAVKSNEKINEIGYHGLQEQQLEERCESIIARVERERR